ncbi:SEC-C metal-binding domain-containing protein [Pseudomonadota bacterium]
MPVIPAFCDDCGTAFSSGIFMENCTNVSLGGNKSGPCPNCGGMGSVPDGVFNVIGNVIDIIDAPRKTVEQLSRYVKVLHEARAQNLSREDVKSKIDKDIPELSGISSYLPKTRTELYAFLALLISLFTVLKEDPKPQDINIMINNTVEQMMIQQQKELSVATEKQSKFEFERPSRNALCTCGSGSQYKNCCGEII